MAPRNASGSTSCTASRWPDAVVARRAASGLLGALLAVGGWIPSPARAQQDTLPAIADSPTAQTLFSDALAQSAENPGEAARLARRLLDEYGAKIIRVGAETDGIYVSVADETERFLLAHPAVLARFRDNESVLADQMLAADGPDATAARRRLTRAGLVASLVLAERALASDRPAETRALLARVAKHPDLSGRERVAHLALDAAAGRRLGLDMTAALAALERLAHGEEFGAALRDEARAAFEQAQRTKARPPSDRVRSPLLVGPAGEAPDSTWREIWSLDLEGTFYQRLYDGPMASLAPRILERARQDATWMNACPTVVGRTIYLCEGQRVRAIDADSRDVRWTRALGSIGVERDTGGITDLSAIAADGGALVLFEGHALASGRTSTPRIWCLEPETGDVRWVIDLDRHEGRTDFEGLYPVGAPILLSDTVVVAARKSTQRLEQVDWLVGLDRRDGSVRWSTSIAGAPGTRLASGRRHAGLALDGGTIVVATPLGVTARVRAADGAIEWLRQTPVPLRDARLAAEAWEFLAPVVAAGRVITISSDANAVEAIDRETGKLVETRVLGPGTAWGDPRYLLAANASKPGGAEATQLVLGVGSDIVAFDARALDKPLWRFSETIREGKAPRAGVDNRSGIRGRVTIAGGAVLVPGLEDLLVLDLATGAVRARIEGQTPCNAVLVDDRIVAAGDQTLRVLMSSERAESILRARLAASPDDPSAALALLELARATGRPPLALEAARAGDGAFSRGFGGDSLREAFLDQLIELASSSPEHGLEAHEIAARIAVPRRLKVRQMLAYGDFFRLDGRAREAIQVWSNLASDPELGAELALADGIARAVRVEATRRIARVAARDTEITAAFDRDAETALAALRATKPAPADLVRFAHTHPRTGAAVDAVVAASASLAPAESSRAVGVVLSDLLVPPARIELVDRLIGDFARGARDPAQAARLSTRAAQLLVASGLSRPELSAQTAAIPRIGLVPGAGRDVRGRLARFSDAAERTRRTDLLLSIADGALQRLALDTLKPLWRLRLDDRDPLILQAAEHIVAWQTAGSGSDGALIINPESGAIELTTPSAAEIWSGPAPKDRPEADLMPDGGAFIAAQVVPICADGSLTLVRRNGDLALYSLADLRSPPRLARGVLSQVYSASVQDGLLVLGGRGGSADEPRPVVVVLDARTLEVRSTFEPASREDVRWGLATALGEVFVGTPSGVERWIVGPDGTPVPLMVTRGSGCSETHTPRLLGSSLVVLDRHDRPQRIPLYEGPEVSLTLEETAESRERTVRALLSLPEGLLVHSDNRLILFSHSGELQGVDMISGEPNFRFVLRSPSGLLAFDAPGPRQVPGAVAGSVRIEFVLLAQPLSTQAGLRAVGDPFELRCADERAERAQFVDGWLLVSTSQGMSAVEMPEASGAAPATPAGR